MRRLSWIALVAAAGCLGTPSAEVTPTDADPAAAAPLVESLRTSGCESLSLSWPVSTADVAPHVPARWHLSEDPEGVTTLGLYAYRCADENASDVVIVTLLVLPDDEDEPRIEADFHVVPVTLAASGPAAETLERWGLARTGDVTLTSTLTPAVALVPPSFTMTAKGAATFDVVAAQLPADVHAYRIGLLRVVDGEAAGGVAIDTGPRSMSWGSGSLVGATGLGVADGTRPALAWRYTGEEGAPHALTWIGAPPA